MEAGTTPGTEPFKGPSLYLFTAGIMALLVAPFLTWFSYGMNFLFPSQVSLVWMVEQGYWSDLTFYLLGVLAVLVITVVARRPVPCLGVLPAAFPLFILIVTLSTYFNGSMGYAQAVTVGMFTALLGSVLLESSYVAYQRLFAKSPASVR